MGAAGPGAVVSGRGWAIDDRARSDRRLLGGARHADRDLRLVDPPGVHPYPYDVAPDGRILALIPATEGAPGTDRAHELAGSAEVGAHVQLRCGLQLLRPLRT